MAKPKKSRLIDRLQTIGQKGRSKSGMITLLTPEQRAEAEEVLQQKVDGRLARVSYRIIAEHFTDEFNLDFSTCMVAEMVRQRRRLAILETKKQ